MLSRARAGIAILILGVVVPERPAIADDGPWVVRVQAGLWWTTQGSTNTGNGFGAGEVERQFTPQFSVAIMGAQTLTADVPNSPCCVPQSVSFTPFVVTAKWNIEAGRTFRPYVGAGPAVFVYDNGASSNTSVGLALQAGVDIRFADHLYFNVDAKYLTNTGSSAQSCGEGCLPQLSLTINPLFLSAGIAVRF